MVRDCRPIIQKLKTVLSSQSLSVLRLCAAHTYTHHHPSHTHTQPEGLMDLLNYEYPGAKEDEHTWIGLTPRTETVYLLL